MNVATQHSRDVDRTPSAVALVVLGMHRSGTSAVTGALRLCGAWVGDEPELTGANEENPRGFWERRDIRRICDRLLQTAGAEWWKVANFDPSCIPPVTLNEQRQEFARVVSTLNDHRTWVIKEPRLCLLLPVLRDYLTNPFCIHVYRNPLEVARSLQKRNGFGIAGGIALWEAYNRHALNSAASIPRVMVSHESLMKHPVETLDELLERLEAQGVTHLARPDEEEVGRFISPALYRCKATEEEEYEYLTPSQRVLWEKLRITPIRPDGKSSPASPVARQNLLDLESSQHSIDHHKEAIRGFVLDLKGRDATIRERDNTIRDRDGDIRALKRRASALNAQLEKRAAEIHDLQESNSWKITAPLRTVVTLARSSCKYVRHLPRTSRLFLARNASSILDACIPTYNRYVPSSLDVILRKSVYKWLVRHVLYLPADASASGAPITTYVLCAEWCERHPKSMQSIIRSQQAIIVVGNSDIVRNTDATIIGGPFGRDIALASVSTETAILVEAEADARATAWSAWRRAAEEAADREQPGVRLLSASTITRTLSSNQRQGLD